MITHIACEFLESVIRRFNKQATNISLQNLSVQFICNYKIWTTDWQGTIIIVRSLQDIGIHSSSFPLVIAARHRPSNWNFCPSIYTGLVKFEAPARISRTRYSHSCRLSDLFPIANHLTATFCIAFQSLRAENPCHRCFPGRASATLTAKDRLDR